MIIFKVTQSKILDALQSVNGIVARSNIMPILANVLIKKTSGTIQFTTSDLRIQISTTTDLCGYEGDFTTTVGSRKLIDILRTLPKDQTVTLESSDTKCILKSGKSKFTLKTLPAEDFPLVKELNEFKTAFSVPQRTLKALLKQVSFSMAVHDIRYYLNGMLFEVEGSKLTLVSTDGHRMAIASAFLEEVGIPNLDVVIPKQEVILPGKTVHELERLLSDVEGDIEIQFSSNQAKFSFDSMEFVTKLVEGKFPDYNRMIPVDPKHTITLGRSALLATLQRTAILSGEKFKGVRMCIEPGTLRLSANNYNQEEAVDELDVDYSGESLEMGFNVTYLIEVLSNLTQEMVTLNISDGNSSMLFTIPENDQFKYVVMPLRI